LFLIFVFVYFFFRRIILKINSTQFSNI
jgi:hypothetical protein